MKHLIAAIAFLFSTVAVAAAEGPLTGLWWNPAESGWGVTITQQNEVVYATLFSYDNLGKPTWFVSTCKLEGNTCSGTLFETSLGKPFWAWGDAKPEADVVGGIKWTFEDANSAVMSYRIGPGIWGEKQLVRQVF